MFLKNPAQNYGNFGAGIFYLVFSKKSCQCCKDKLGAILLCTFIIKIFLEYANIVVTEANSSMLENCKINIYPFFELF